MLEPDFQHDTTAAQLCRPSLQAEEQSTPRACKLKNNQHLGSGTVNSDRKFLNIFRLINSHWSESCPFFSHFDQESG